MKKTYYYPRTEMVNLHGIEIMIPDMTPTSSGEVTPANPMPGGGLSLPHMS